MVAYALRHGEQEIPHRSVRRRMALHQLASSRAHRTRTPQASQLAGYPRRRFLRPEERLPLAVAAEGLPALENSLRLVQEVAYRWDVGAFERRAAQATKGAVGQEPATQRRDRGFSEIGRAHV